MLTYGYIIVVTCIQGDPYRYNSKEYILFFISWNLLKWACEIYSITLFIHFSFTFQNVGRNNSSNCALHITKASSWILDPSRNRKHLENTRRSHRDEMVNHYTLINGYKVYLLVSHSQVSPLGFGPKYFTLWNQLKLV